MMVLYHIIKKGGFIINFLGVPLISFLIVPYRSLSFLIVPYRSLSFLIVPYPPYAVYSFDYSCDWLFMRLVIHAVIEIFYMTFFLLNFMLYHHHRSLFSLQPISSAR